MNEIAKLFQQIEALSPASQAALAQYVEFLAWQEEQNAAAAATGWSFSFIEAFKEASVYASQDPAGMDVKMAPALAGGERLPALWAHPPLVGQAVIEYYVPVPTYAGQMRLHLAIGIRDGAQIAESNLVAFSVRVNGLRVWGHQTNIKAWQPADIALNLPSGDIARIEFTTETLGSHEWTWAVWGNPELRGVSNSTGGAS